MQGLPRSGNSPAQTSASLHPPAALRLRVLPFTRTWSSTVCAEEFPTPLEMSLHGLPLLRHSKSVGPSAPIAYATCVSPPEEAAAWPRAGVRWQMRLPLRGECTEGNRTVGNAPPGNALCGEYYSPALRRSAFSATWSWSITSWISPSIKTGRLWVDQLILWSVTRLCG